MDRVARLNGEPTPDASAGRTLGLTCFETIAVTHGTPRLADRHLERLRASTATLRLEPLGGWPSLTKQVEAALAEWGTRDGVLRVSLHARAAATGLRVGEPHADVLVLVTLPRYPDLQQGVAATLSSVQAPDPASWPAHVKAPCLPRMLAYREATDAGAFEALMVDARGNVVSGSRSNVFIVRDGSVATPPSPPCFPGITRERAIAALSVQGVPVQVRLVRREELERADEVFVTFTGAGVVPVVSIGPARVADGRRGPLTRGLAHSMR